MSFTIRELLHGTKVGRMQSVGLMQVIPLVLASEDLASDNFATPRALSIDTNQGYGNMGFTNKDTEKPVIIPTNTMVLTKRAAQDHAMVKTGLLDKSKHRIFNDACCVQGSQGGYFDNIEGDEIQILPFALRETALNMRGQREFGKLWPAISNFNKVAKSGTDSNLVSFQTKYGTLLDQFVAEFECVPNQVGAIILVDGQLLGVERTPSVGYWLSVWEPLIRMCYGSQAVIASVGKTTGTSPSSSSAAVAILDEGITSLDELEAAVKSAIRGEEDAARKVVRDLIDDQFESSVDDTLRTTREGHTYDVKVWNIAHDQFVGQAITDDGIVVYASMTSKAGWKRRHAARQTAAFVL